MRSLDIKIEERGRLLYLQRNYEYTFPFFEMHDEVMIGGVPTCFRIFLPLMGGWHNIPSPLTRRMLKEIHRQIIQFFRAQNRKVRLIEPPKKGAFNYFSELVEHRDNVLVKLHSHGFALMHDFSSVDILQEEYGVEICGIHGKSRALLLSSIVAREFPYFHYRCLYYQESSREPGWKLLAHMLPACKDC